MPTATAVSVPLEAVTPLFAGGAVPRGEPELRPPAFRGALRYWLRAALGGALGADVAEVRRAEAAVFGSAGDEPVGASPVVVRVRHDDEVPSVQKYQPVGNRDYLYWSMGESTHGAGDSRPYFRPGGRFTLTLASRPGVRSQGALRQATAALWLLVQLGGMGARSRRAGGSLSVPEPLEVDGLPFALTGSAPAGVAAQLGAGLRRVRAICGAVGPPRPLPLPSAFDVLHPDACGVWVLEAWDRAETAADALGTKLHDFRIPPRGGARTGPSLVERAEFGLPLKGLEVRRSRERLDRRASPLWLTLSKTTAGRSVAVATLFRSQFLPQDAALIHRGERTPPPASVDLIERWLREAFPSAHAVSYA